MYNPEIVLEGILFGLVVCAPIGPVFAASIRFGIAGGYLSALKVQFGSLAGDIFYAIIGLSALSVIAKSQLLLSAFGYLTIFVLLTLAVFSFKSVFIDQRNAPKRSSRFGPLSTGVLISLLSFDNLALWAGVTQSYVGENGKVSPDIFVFIAGFFVSAIIWVVCSATLAGVGVKRLSPTLIKAVHFLIAIALLIFAHRIFTGLS